MNPKFKGNERQKGEEIMKLQMAEELRRKGLKMNARIDPRY